jgi:hypothetical protein
MLTPRTKFILTATFVFGIISGCDFIYKDNGRFGNSESKEEALKNNSEVSTYLPDKYKFSLLDGTILQLDTAWTEISFSYKNGKRIYDSSNGFHFSIPFKKEVPESFTFSLSLADTTNRSFTNGGGEKLIQLCPTNLYDEMKVVLEQKDPDTSKGWTHRIITDTITFKRIEKHE